VDVVAGDICTIMLDSGRILESTSYFFFLYIVS
jgi:hypothetical protein